MLRGKCRLCCLSSVICIRCATAITLAQTRHSPGTDPTLCSTMRGGDGRDFGTRHTCQGAACWEASLTRALLALADGKCFTGVSVGSDGEAIGEVVFNTAMTGYQEILSDPSYCQQLVTLTCPHIGNVGCNPEDMESSRAQVAGLIIRSLSPQVSSFRARQSLQQFLCEQQVVAIAEVDTRKLTRHIRQNGVQAACLITGSDTIHVDDAVQKARDFPGLSGMDLASKVSTREPYNWQQGSWSASDGYAEVPPDANNYRVIAYDFGIKYNMLRLLASRGCTLTVVPAKTPAAEVLAQQPDGILLSNGPGDPAPCDYAINAIGRFIEAQVPLLGICLGYQLMALACGARSVKMDHGHHGANHPVRELATNRVLISSQNHGFCIDEGSLPAELKATHVSLFDGTLQGIRHTCAPALGFQGHPEASPGPTDAVDLFQAFIDLMSHKRHAKA